MKILLFYALLLFFKQFLAEVKIISKPFRSFNLLGNLLAIRLILLQTVRQDLLQDNCGMLEKYDKKMTMH